MFAALEKNPFVVMGSPYRDIDCERVWRNELNRRLGSKARQNTGGVSHGPVSSACPAQRGQPDGPNTGMCICVCHQAGIAGDASSRLQAGSAGLWAALETWL